MLSVYLYMKFFSGNYYLSGSYVGGPINLGDFPVDISWNGYLKFVYGLAYVSHQSICLIAIK